MINLKFRQRNSYRQLTACFVFMAMALLAGAQITAQAVPTSRLLYVLDTGEGWFEHSQILQFDTGQGKILKTFMTGEDPDMALSPDGSRLYVTTFTFTQDSDTAPLENHLSIYDTASGKLLERIRNPDAIQHTMLGYATALAVSPSGRWLYMAKFHGNPDKSYYWYETAFDTIHNQFLPVQVKFPCRNVTLVPMREDLSLVLVCRDSPFFFDIDLGNSKTPMKRVAVRPAIDTGSVSSAPGDTAATLMPLRPQESWSAVFLQPGVNSVALVSNLGGSIFSFDRSAGASTKVGQEPRLKSIGLERGFVSSDGNHVYFQIASSPLPSDNQSLSRHDQILAVDPNTVAVKGVLKTSKRFFTMVLSQDGHTIFTVNPDAATIGVVDASTLTEIKQIPGVGRRPIYVIAAP